MGLLSLTVDTTGSTVFILALHMCLNRKDINSLVFNSKELEVYKETHRFEDIKKNGRSVFGNSDFSN